MSTSSAARGEARGKQATCARRACTESTHQLDRSAAPISANKRQQRNFKMSGNRVPFLRRYMCESFPACKTRENRNNMQPIEMKKNGCSGCDHLKVQATLRCPSRLDPMHPPLPSSLLCVCFMPPIIHRSGLFDVECAHTCLRNCFGWSSGHLHWELERQTS